MSTNRCCWNRGSTKHCSEERLARRRRNMAFEKEPDDEAATVLVVDDDDDVRAVTAAALENCGLHVIEAASAAEAPRLLDEPHGIDVIVTDVVMPGVSGFHVVRGAEERHIKVLVTSAYADGL